MMKTLFLTLSILCVFGFTIFNPFQDQQKVDFEWLLGTWKRTNEKQGIQTFEYWKKIDKDHYKGLGFTMKRSDTIWQESLNLVKKKGFWNFKVKLQNASEETVFKVTSIEQKGFVCENKQNEFPKKIAYKRSGNNLIALISDADRKVSFDFDKIK